MMSFRLYIHHKITNQNRTKQSAQAKEAFSGEKLAEKYDWNIHDFKLSTVPSAALTLIKLNSFANIVDKKYTVMAFTP